MGPGPRLAALLLAVTLWAGPTEAQTQEPIEIFDAHLHYNWDPKPFLPLPELLALLKSTRVTGILANSRPNDGSRALLAAKPQGIEVVAFIRPYRVRADISSWFGDPKTLDLIENEFKRGGYRGIGEFHLSGRNAETEWVKKTVDFAVAHGLYLLAHADEEAIEILYRHNTAARVIWAHTGFSLAPERVAALLDKYPMLWGELSYRGGITSSDGELTPEWRALFERHSDRFLLGSDTWIDERWSSYGAIMAQYRQWLAQLPPAVAARIAHGNARRLFAPASGQ